MPTGPAAAAFAALLVVALAGAAAHVPVGPLAVEGLGSPTPASSTGPASGPSPGPGGAGRDEGLRPQHGGAPRDPVPRDPVPRDPASPEQALVHRPPVRAPIVDPFRLPSGPFGPGNRGLEYDTSPGQAVRASADGVVAFAGAVAGSLHVSIDHADGLRTSYSHLATVAVVPGPIAAGVVVGTAGERLHFGMRRGGVYIDPATVLDDGARGARLVPHRRDR